MAQSEPHSIHFQQRHDASTERIGRDATEEVSRQAQPGTGAGRVEWSTTDDRGHFPVRVDDDVDESFANDRDHGITLVDSVVTPQPPNENCDGKKAKQPPLQCVDEIAHGERHIR